MTHILLFHIILIIITLSHLSNGNRGHYEYDPVLVSNLKKYNISEKEYYGFARDYLKLHELTINDGQYSIKKKDLTTGDKNGKLLQSLRIPGTSGTYAYTNSFYMFDKIINTAISISYAPLLNGFPHPQLPPPYFQHNTGIAASPAASGAFISSDLTTTSDNLIIEEQPIAEDSIINTTATTKYPNPPYFLFPFGIIPTPPPNRNNNTIPFYPNYPFPPPPPPYRHNTTGSFYYPPPPPPHRFPYKVKNIKSYQ